MGKTSYKGYKTTLLYKLIKVANSRYRGPGSIAPGQWKGTDKNHILPLENKSDDIQRRNAVEKYLGIKIDSFLDKTHLYVHHLNSSQLLCYNAFRPLIAEKHNATAGMQKLLSACGVSIREGAKCHFEHIDNWYWKEAGEKEGTSFDFYISDGEREFYFEAKFSEDGFGRGDDAKSIERHKAKFEQLYSHRLEACVVLKKKPDCEDFLRYYQLFRNVLRCTGENQTIIFLVDRNNPFTNRDLDNFQKEYITENNPHVKIIYWQDIKQNWPNSEFPFQFAAL